MSEISNKNFDKMTEEELTDEIKKINSKLNEKILENEIYQQELHELRNKLKACLAMQKDLSIANETMEEKLTHHETLMQKTINLLSEKFSAERKIYEEKITELEISLSREEMKNVELKESLNVQEKLFNTLRNQEPDKNQENLMLMEKINCLNQDLEKMKIIECEFLSREAKLEESNTALQKNYNEVRDILQVKKEDLASLNEILETTRDELVSCRSELETLKAAPASDSIKGNSLFAEVEDNRRKLIAEMTKMKKQYLYMKNSYDEKDNEIRILNAQKASLLDNLKDVSGTGVDQCARLIQTYKSRICELENKLKVEEKKLKLLEKNKDQPANNSFSYLQSLLNTKKKEIEELSNKLEARSIEKIINDEMNHEIERQLKKWKYTALSYQAKLFAVEKQPKCDQCLKINSGDKEQVNSESAEISKPVNRPDSSQEKLLEVQTRLSEVIISTDNSIFEVSDKSGEKNPEAGLHESSSDMEETLPVCNLARDNIPSTSNDNETILKSALAGSEKTSQEKFKKSLRFTSDTVDMEKPKLTRHKMEKKPYPIVFISSKQLKK